jgi:sec-independent protein translocase protein TatB
MFDISFFKLVVIGVVALIFIGPERLPKVARTAGFLFGRLQRYVANVKADIAREIEQSELNQVKTEFQQAARDVEQSVSQQARSVEAEVQAVTQQIQHDNPLAKPVTPETPTPQMDLGLDAPPSAKPH